MTTLSMDTNQNNIDNTSKTLVSKVAGGGSVVSNSRGNSADSSSGKKSEAEQSSSKSSAGATNNNKTYVGVSTPKTVGVVQKTLSSSNNGSGKNSPVLNDTNKTGVSINIPVSNQNGHVSNNVGSSSRLSSTSSDVFTNIAADSKSGIQSPLSKLINQQHHGGSSDSLATPGSPVPSISGGKSKNVKTTSASSIRKESTESISSTSASPQPPSEKVSTGSSSSTSTKKKSTVPAKSAKGRRTSVISQTATSRRDSLVSTSTGTSRRISLADINISSSKARELGALMGKLHKMNKDMGVSGGSGTQGKGGNTADAVIENLVGQMNGIEEEGSANGDEGEKPEFDERVVRVLEGYLNDLPGLPSRIVRIFTSSTFTDTTNERNALMENIYPKLKEYCREKHGLEFQVVDMRWGVRDDATDDHKTTELCMKEIENCQRLSMGPNFVLFLGQKYGYRPIPAVIPADEYEMLRDIIKDNQAERDLLDTWFKKDQNAEPRIYILQPISTWFVNFNNKRHPRLMEQDQNSWWDTLTKLQLIIRKAAISLALVNKLNSDQKHNYFMSVTEREVRKGIISAKDTKEHCLAFVRELTGINLQALSFCRNFIDMAGHTVDGEAQKFLKKLRDERLPVKLPETNIGRFTIEWTGREGMEGGSHKEYIETFCDHFHDSIIELIDRAVEESQKLSSDPVYSETLQHLHACHNSCKVFQGRGEIVERIQGYICGDSTEPLVLWGYSGCGKTSLLAKGYSQTHEWLTKNNSKPVCLLRFLGTSPDSSSIIPLLCSLCKQLSIDYDQPVEDIPQDLSPLVTHFKHLLTCATAEKPVVVYLDSLDQLSGASGAHQMAWLPVILPPNCKVVVSTLPDYYNILIKLRKIILTEDNFIQVSPLGKNLGKQILESWLENAQRKVTDEQWVIVQEVLEKCNLPLFVKLVFDVIQGWRSYQSKESTTLAQNIHDIIMKLFEKIEFQHGKILVSAALGYITASKGGLSEAELEDLLSLDEKVLNDVYQYHLPPVRRIPPLLWTRIRNDLPHYLSEREADGINVINWYHRQFIEVSRERYFKNLSFLESMHSQLADYFLGMWGGGKSKPFQYSDLQRQRFAVGESGGDADRKVPEQPMNFTDENGKVIRYNLRKLSELPFHLIRAHRLEDLNNEVLFNFRFLHAKISAMPLQAMIADFEDALDHNFDTDIKLLADTLRLSASMLSRHPDMLGPQIVGRLLPYYHTHAKIQSLIKQCDSEGLEVNALVPCYHCMHTPGGPLQYSLEGHPFAPFGIAITSDAKYLVSVSSLVIMWDINSGDVFRQIDPKIQGIMQCLVISPDDKHAFSYTNNDHVVIFNLLTGDVKVLTKPVDGIEAVLGISGSNEEVIIWTSNKWYLYSVEGELIKKGSGKDKGGMNIIHADVTEQINEKILVWKTEKPIPGVETDEDMIIEITNSDLEEFHFHSAIAISNDKKKLYACIAISDDTVACYKRVAGEKKWVYDRSLGTNYDKIFTLTLSPDEKYLVATIALGYKIWELGEDTMKELKLPLSVRNIPNKNPLISGIVFTKHNNYLVAGVRNNIYVWDAKNNGELVKTLDAHFGRILCIRSVFTNSINKIVSSSIDKSIKIWNFDNVLEEVFSIDRNDKAIDNISLAANAYIGATTTRNCVGVWNLESGKLMKTLANSARSSIVTHSVITGDAKYVVSAESGNILFWDVDKEKCYKMDPQQNVHQMFLADEDDKVIVVSKSNAENKGKCVCRHVRTGDTVFTFEYEMQGTIKPCVVTTDGLYLVTPCLNKTGENLTLGIYHAKTGTHMYNTTPKYPDYKDFTALVAIPNESHHVALIDTEKGNIWDIKKKSFVKSVMKWNGVCTSTGRYGLYAPNRGGLELLDLKNGKVKHTLIPRIAEGVFTNLTLFTCNDQHVIYYHSGHRSIRVFRVSDGKQIANYRAHAEVKAISSTRGGTSIVLGIIDGSVIVLTVADPKNKYNKEFLSGLPSRHGTTSPEGSPAKNSASNGGISGSPDPNDPSSAIAMSNNAKKSFATMAAVARVVAKSRQHQKSRACVLQ